MTRREPWFRRGAAPALALLLVATAVAAADEPAADQAPAPPGLDRFVAETIATFALDDEEAAFLRETLAPLAPADAEAVMDALWRHPKFPEAALRAEFEQRMPSPEVKYPPELLAKLTAEADRRFHVFRKGETITVPDPHGAAVREFTGEYQGLFEDALGGQGTVPRRKVKVGGRFFMLEDLPGEVRDRFDEAAMAREHGAFLGREYHQPRESYVLAYQDLLRRRLEEARQAYCAERRALVRDLVAKLPPAAPAPK